MLGSTRVLAGTLSLLLLATPATAGKAKKYKFKRDCSKPHLEKRYFEVLTAAIPAGLHENYGTRQYAHYRWPRATLKRTALEQDRPGPVYFDRGELARVTFVDGTSVTILAAHPHSLTRGIGAFRHESLEKIGLLISVHKELRKIPCGQFLNIWSRYFKEVVDLEDWERTRANTASGVMVDEIKEGMSPAEVESVLGVPERKASMAEKMIYFYPDMKVIFRGGKVADIE